jgi:hypothetical protein
MSRLQLICHPATPCPVALSIAVLLSPAECDGEPLVQLDFEATGDVHRLRIPAAFAYPEPTDGLWHHTCFEAFVASASGTCYREFNLSPSGQWAHYLFANERLRAEQEQTAWAPGIAVAQSPASLNLSACLPVKLGSGPIHWGLSAVIELDNGSLSYWALHHPKVQPDFHDRGGWTLTWPDGIA